MVHEDYLPCDAYAGQNAHLTESEFVAFQTEDGRYFFAMIDAMGGILLKSEGYPQMASRENGIQSVLKNRANRDFYSIKSEDGRYFWSLRAANYREIARSCDYETEAAAQSDLDYLTGEKTRHNNMGHDGTARESNKIDDDYLATHEYEGQGEPDGASIVKFQSERTGLYYFAWVDNDGSVLMRSEGYPTTGARDNGADSVVRNRDNEARYATKMHPDGKYIVSLKAGNHQEIGRSPRFDSEAAAQSVLPSVRAARLAAAEAAKAAALAAAAVPAAAAAGDSDRYEDDYMACKYYENRGARDENGMVKFFDETSSKHYFVWLDESGKIILRSEGYPTPAARDNGYNSVVKNRVLEERFGTIEKMGRHFVILKAGNHQEIGRSCPKGSSAEAMGLVSTALGVTAAGIGAIALTDIAAEAPPVVVIPEPAPAPAEAAPVMAAPKVVDIEDDYLACKDYKGHDGRDKNGIVRFDKNGLHYFAWVYPNGDVCLRGEGHPDEADREKDIEAVLANRFNRSRYDTMEKMGHHFSILRDASGKEIARSCAKSSAAEATTAASESAIPAAGLAAAAVVAATPTPEPVKVAVPKAEAPKVVIDIEDDYLACKDYQNAGKVDTSGIVKFRNAKNNLYYFAWVDAKGNVLLRGEGHPNSNDRDRDVSAVLANRGNKERYSTIEKMGYFFSVLKDAQGKEIGRSCPQKDKAAAWSLFPAFAPVAAVAAAAVAAIPKVETPKVEIPKPKVVVETPKKIVPPPVAAVSEIVETEAAAAFNWWPWLLAAALLGLGWWLLGKPGCAEATVKPAVVPTVPVAPSTPPATTATVTPAPVQQATTVSKVGWIFFDFDKSDLRAESKATLEKAAAILKAHPDYNVELRAHTDWKGTDTYNIALSERRAATSKAYLAKELSISGDRIKTTRSGEKDPLAKNQVDGKDTEEGRQLNRRVEIYITDKAGKVIDAMVDPTVPTAGLKAK